MLGHKAERIMTSFDGRIGIAADGPCEKEDVMVDRGWLWINKLKRYDTVT